MNSFTLNQLHLAHSLTYSSSDSEFKLLKVLIHQSSRSFQAKKLKKILTGFYLEMEECCSLNSKIVMTRHRPFELSKEVELSNNSIHFDQIVSNVMFDLNGNRLFYDQLNVKLVSRYELYFDLNFEVYYDGKGIAPIQST